MTEVQDRWKLTNMRRNAHKEKGFFSLNYLPYKSFGDLNIIDAYDLLSDCLSLDASKQQVNVQIL